jgi:hypothetical protein
MWKEPTAPRCPDCGNVLTDGHAQRCGVPKLLAAIGDVELTGQERLYVRWLAGCGDFETVEVFSAIFRKVAEGKPLQPATPAG